MTHQIIKEMLGKKVWAVVGATPNPHKTGNEILKVLIDEGYDVYAVNPNYDEIEPGIKCWHSLAELPVVPDCVDFVVPPKVTLANLQDMDSNTMPYVWFQPGTYDETVVKYAEEKGFKAVHNLYCVMVELHRH
jgi:uncharacterized protein